ncbi:hypothetical protein [Streptococcus sp. E17BB]
MNELNLIMPQLLALLAILLPLVTVLLADLLTVRQVKRPAN